MRKIQFASATLTLAMLLQCSSFGQDNLKNEFAGMVTKEHEAKMAKMGQYEQAAVRAILAGNLDAACEHPVNIPAVAEGGVFKFQSDEMNSRVFVFQIINGSEFIARIGPYIWISNYPTSGISEDAVTSVKDRLFIMIGNKQYPTPDGSTNTVKEIRLVDEAAVYSMVDEVVSESGFRRWSNGNGGFQYAKFKRKSNGKVYFELPDGKQISVKLDQLSESDKNFLKRSSK